jgi:hypothetical protein
MESNISKEEEKYEQIKEEYDRMVEKSLYYKLKRWEKNLMKKLRSFYLSLKYIKEYREEIKRQNEKHNEDIKKEMDSFEKEKEEIINRKNESIKQIEIKKQNLITENDTKYKKIITYLEEIKNDKNKLIEFLSDNKVLL